MIANRFCILALSVLASPASFRAEGAPAGASERARSITPAQAAKIKYSTQRFEYLDVGETFVFRLKDGAERRIRLISVSEEKDSVIGLVRRAEVKVEIDGETIALTCAPYVMPTETRGLRIQADTTSAWLDIPKRVQFSLWDATDPIVDAKLFGFPLAGYRLFSHGMQAYNEPVHLGHRDGDPAGQRFYHNYGIDLAGYEGRQKVLSAIDGVVAGANPEQGDLTIKDDRGVIVHFGHLDSILSGIREGAQVKRGQWVGMLGRRGGSGNFSHLHVGIFLSDTDLSADRAARNLNLYPWVVAAYRSENDAGPFAVARPHKAVLTGEKVLFEGASSMAPGSSIESFRWESHDGTRAEGARAEKVYEKPGCYIASLWVKDARGRVDVDFCRVRVYSRSKPEDVVPTLFVTFEPSAGVLADRPVHFRIWPQGRDVSDIRVDFGDGATVQGYEPYSAITHSFRDAGIHIVTVTGTAGDSPVTEKVVVHVETASVSLDRLPILPGLHAVGQFSSHNKKGLNGDSRWRLYDDEHGDAVIFDVEGPGCVRSLWGTDIREGATFRFHFDGEDAPRYTIPLLEFYQGKHPLFPPPLASYERRGRWIGDISWMPSRIRIGPRASRKRPRHGRRPHRRSIPGRLSRSWMSSGPAASAGSSSRGNPPTPSFRM